MGRKRDNFLRSKVSIPSKVQFFCKFKPSIGCSISRIISRFEGEFFDGEETSEASFEIKQGVSSRHCRRARRFSRQIVMARPAPLVARSTATRHSRAESPERLFALDPVCIARGRAASCRNRPRGSVNRQVGYLFRGRRRSVRPRPAL